jgi:hypothetical protein
LADTLWRLGALVPLFGGAEAEDPKDRHPAAAVMLRRLQQESQDTIEAQLTMSRSAMDHAAQAAHRLSTAHDPMDAAVAQTAFALAATIKRHGARRGPYGRTRGMPQHYDPLREATHASDCRRRLQGGIGQSQKSQQPGLEDDHEKGCRTRHRPASGAWSAGGRAGARRRRR